MIPLHNPYAPPSPSIIRTADWYLDHEALIAHLAVVAITWGITLGVLTLGASIAGVLHAL